MHIFHTLYILIALGSIVSSRHNTDRIEDFKSESEKAEIYNDTLVSLEEDELVDYSDINNFKDDAQDAITETTMKPTPRPDPPKKCDFNRKVCVKKWQCRKRHNTGKFMINLMPKNNCDYLEVCCDPQKLVDFVQPRPEVVECGHANPAGVLMAINGDRPGLANFGSYPWTVAIFNEDYEYRCSGSLIHHKVVLATGSCLGPDKAKLIARAGEWDMKSDKEILPHQEIDEYTKIYHPQYDKISQEYNIALLVLKRGFAPLPHMQPACLATNDRKFVETDCLITGWQRYSRNPQLLLETKRMSISNTSNPNSNLFLASSQEEGLEYAQGSSLVCPWMNSENRYSIKGLWTPAIGEGDEKHFLNVTIFTSWIVETLQNKYQIDVSP